MNFILSSSGNFLVNTFLNNFNKTEVTNKAAITTNNAFTEI